MIIEQLFGVQIVCTHPTLSELCIKQKKKETKGERMKERRKQQNLSFQVRYSQVWEGLMQLWEYIFNRIAKGFNYNSFASLCCVFLELLAYVIYRTLEPGQSLLLKNLLIVKSFDMQNIHIWPVNFMLRMSVWTNRLLERDCNACLEP